MDLSEDSEDREAYLRVAELDMSAVDGLDEAGLRLYFEAIATNASSAHLRSFLTGYAVSPAAIDDEDAQERRDLELAYVDRRLDTVARMREGASSFESTFRILDGD